MKKKLEFGQLFNYFPAPVVLVSCGNGKKGVMAAAWFGIACSEPPIVFVSIRPHRLSNEIIRKSGEFAVNVPSEEMLEKVDLIGTISGREIDKFSKYKLAAEKGVAAGAPLIGECPINIECKVKQIIPLGTHDVFMGEVLAIHTDKAVLKDGKVDFSKLRPLVLLEKEYWSMGKKLAEYGYSRAKK